MDSGNVFFLCFLLAAVFGILGGCIGYMNGRLSHYDRSDDEE